MAEPAARTDVDELAAESGIKGCDAVWPYDSNRAYFGMKLWAETLVAALVSVREERDEALRKLTEVRAAIEQDIEDPEHESYFIRRISRLWVSYRRAMELLVQGRAESSEARAALRQIADSGPVHSMPMQCVRIAREALKQAGDASPEDAQAPKGPGA